MIRPVDPPSHPDPGPNRRAREFDTCHPAPARIYNYVLGGKDNFDADHHAVEQILEFVPDYALVAEYNRGFIRRAVARLVRDEGIDQIIDIGAGIPAPGATHEVAQSINPDTRVVYVDNDPIVLAHARGLMNGPRVHTIVADVTDPYAVLDHPELRERIDWSRPVAVLMVAVLHFVADEDRPGDIVAAIRDRVADGSWLALSHAFPGGRLDNVEGVTKLLKSIGFTAPVAIRSRQEIEDLFTGWDLTEPVTTVGAWAAEQPKRVRGSDFLAGLARREPRG